MDDQIFKLINDRLSTHETKIDDQGKAINALREEVITMPNKFKEMLDSKSSFLSKIPTKVWYIIGGVIVLIAAEYGIDLTGFLR